MRSRGGRGGRLDRRRRPANPLPPRENDRGEKEGFWGVDHLSAVLDFFGLEKPAGKSG